MVRAVHDVPMPPVRILVIPTSRRPPSPETLAAGWVPISLLSHAAWTGWLVENVWIKRVANLSSYRKALIRTTSRRCSVDDMFRIVKRCR